VLVMSDRPGRIIRTIEIDLPRPRLTEMYSTHRFFELLNTVGQAIRSEADHDDRPAQSDNATLDTSRAAGE
jgi:NitT/TauT family transport system ATP-binding protein